METGYIISLALAGIIILLIILIIVLFLKYKRLKSKIYDKVKQPELEENIEDRYFEERIENIKKKLS
jgi:hypothetical protein